MINYVKRQLYFFLEKYNFLSSSKDIIEMGEF